MSGERLDAEWVRTWQEHADAALTKLMQSFLTMHGFPPGQNAVTLATDDSHRATDALVASRLNTLDGFAQLMGCDGTRQGVVCRVWTGQSWKVAR